MESIDMMAACGLDCGTCDIRRAPEDPDAARSLVDWFRRKGWLAEDEGIAQVIEREMYCTGCRGDRVAHWAPDCPLLICCVDENHLQHCAQCDEFVCEKLDTFATDGQAHHREAVERLKRIATSRRYG